MYRFRASEISAAVGRNPYKEWKTVAHEIFERRKFVREEKTTETIETITPKVSYVKDTPPKEIEGGQ